MSPTRVPRTPLIATILILAASAASSQPRTGRVTGTAVDSSGSVLPGVVVVATAGDGRVLGSTVTDGAGGYALNALPAGAARLSFELSGFATAEVPVVLHADSRTLAVGRLELASLAETVVVRGAPERPAPPPKPTLRAVPTHDRDAICGPAKVEGLRAPLGTIRLRPDAQGLFAAGDELTIDGGTASGLSAGQHVVVRRHFQPDGASRSALVGEHTAGLVQIMDAHEHRSTGAVVYACDEVIAGDFLAPFQPEPVRVPAPFGSPAFDRASRILFANAGHMMGVPRRLMVIDHGAEQGIRVAQRLTIFRRGRGASDPPEVIGDAVVVAVRNQSATIRIERATDAIEFGDWAAPQQKPKTEH